MFAIVTIAGQQFKVRQNDEIFVHRLAGNAGDSISIDQVAMSGNEGNVTMGGNAIGAEILAHIKGEKVIVFKKKRRKGYQKSNGHRQSFTKIRIGALA